MHFCLFQGIPPNKLKSDVDIPPHLQQIKVEELRRSVMERSSPSPLPSMYGDSRRSHLDPPTLVSHSSFLFTHVALSSLHILIYQHDVGGFIELA